MVSNDTLTKQIQTAVYEFTEKDIKEAVELLKLCDEIFGKKLILGITENEI